MLPYNEIIFKILLTARNRFYRIQVRDLQKKLAAKKSNQRAKFNFIKKDFLPLYKKIKKYNNGKFVTPWWNSFNTKLEKYFLPSPSFSFLNDSIIMFTMFMTAGGKLIRSELKFLKKNIPHEKLQYVLEEDYVGDPLLYKSPYLTSQNGIHHLYHIIQFLTKTKTDVKKINSIVEWGGGYGSLAKLFIRLKSENCTYTIIDTPFFCNLQWLYLSTVFGEKKVNLITNEKGAIEKNRINILPIGLLDTFKISADLLISTWAISESSRYSQDYVVKNKWFNAKHILLAYQDSDNTLPDAGRIEELARKKGAHIQDIPLLPGNHYAFL